MYNLKATKNRREFQKLSKKTFFLRDWQRNKKRKQLKKKRDNKTCIKMYTSIILYLIEKNEIKNPQAKKPRKFDFSGTRKETYREREREFEGTADKVQLGGGEYEMANGLFSRLKLKTKKDRKPFFLYSNDATGHKSPWLIDFQPLDPGPETCCGMFGMADSNLFA